MNVFLVFAIVWLFGAVYFVDDTMRSTAFIICNIWMASWLIAMTIENCAELKAFADKIRR